MDKHEKRQLRTAAFSKHLQEQLVDEPRPVGVSAVSPLSEVGPKLDGPVGAYRGAQSAKWAEASRGTAGTGRPIPQIHGEPKMKAMRAFISGGTKENGGPGEAGAQAALRKAGLKGAGASVAGWSAIIGCELALTVGPPILTALWQANRDVRAAERAERDES